MLLLDLLKLGDTDSHDDGDRQPRQDDGHRQSTDHPRYEWPTVGQLMVAHFSLSKQEVKALTSFDICSALTSPSTRMRQPMLSLSPCATILPTAVASVLANSTDHGKRAPLTRRGSALASK